jgi:thiamine-monophosphate kinase
MAEFDFSAWLRQQTSADPRVWLGPGDDCAGLSAPPGDRWLVTTDMLMDGVDFRLSETEPRRIGRKAMAVNLSDIAAMAGRPAAAFVSLALPRGGGLGLAKEIYLGLRDQVDAFHTALAGGDTNSWDGPLVISVTLMGHVGPAGPITRAGARPGDWLLVTGQLGGSIRGKHLDFTPRVNEAVLLAEQVSLHAMIDVSDGLAADANHLAEESGCGLTLHAETIPIAPAAYDMDDDRLPLEHALGDGEDFELLFAVAAADARRLLQRQPLPGLPLSHVGTFCEEKGLFLEDGQGRRALPALGYVHRL